MLPEHADGAADVGALPQCVFDQAHATEFADDEDSRAARLKEFVGLCRVSPHHVGSNAAVRQGVPDSLDPAGIEIGVVPAAPA